MDKISGKEFQFILKMFDIKPVVLAEYMGVSRPKIYEWRTNGVPIKRTAEVSQALLDMIKVCV